MEIGELTTLADYFVIATGASNTQINALVDNVEKVLAGGGWRSSPCTGRAIAAARGCCWTTAASPSMSLIAEARELLRPGASVAGRQERGPERRHRRARMKCFRRFSRKTGLTFGKNALK